MREGTLLSSAIAELVAEIDAIAHRHGSREQIFDDFLTMTVCALAGGTREEEYLQVVNPTARTKGEAKRRPAQQALRRRGANHGGDAGRPPRRHLSGRHHRGQHGQFFTPDFRSAT